MEDLLEFLFGASGRINRAKYWRSLLILGVAGMFVGVILLTAAGIAAPLFIVMVVIVFIPWLMWGIAIHSERLHDRDKSAWWLLVFIVLPFVLNIPGFMMFPVALHNMELAIQAAQHHLPPPVMPQSPLATISNGAATILSLWAFVELYCLRGTVGDNRYGPDPIPGVPA